MGPAPIPIGERFWRHVFIMTYDRGCWIWVGSTNPEGYGLIMDTRTRNYAFAHRVAWETLRGPIPLQTPCVLHKCDNRSCVNPDHLFLGTKTDNNRDRDSKFRQAIGERSGKAVTTSDKVRWMRSLHRPGVRGSGVGAIAKAFGVSTGCAWAIISGKTWKHVK